jgi:PPIC-type PPIASE domain
VTRLLKEPLLHFLVLGAALFGLFGLVGKKEAEQPATIVVSAARIESLANGFARTWQRPPSAEELLGLIDDHIRDEVFYREGKALGLDRDDIVIRRRLRQKLEFVAEDMGVAEPSNAELGAYLASRPDRFRSEDRLTFRHVFLSAARRPNSLEGDAEGVAAELADAGAAFDATSLGDHFLLGDEFRAMPRSDMARTFGERFSEQLFGLEQGRWQGPVASSYGLHFVLVSERTQGGLPQLEAVRPAVRREWMNARRLEAEANLYRTLRARYGIVVEAPPAEPAANQELSGAIR